MVRVFVKSKFRTNELNSRGGMCTDGVWWSLYKVAGHTFNPHSSSS
jgi:hypothetical protein